MKKRKCLKCGKDPYPNMYYCKKCHGQVTRQEGWQENHREGLINNSEFSTIKFSDTTITPNWN